MRRTPSRLVVVVVRAWIELRGELRDGARKFAAFAAEFVDHVVELLDVSLHVGDLGLELRDAVGVAWVRRAQFWFASHSSRVMTTSRALEPL